MTTENTNITVKTIQTKAYLTKNQEKLFLEWTHGLKYLYNLGLSLLYESQQQQWRNPEKNKKFLFRYMEKKHLEIYLENPDTYPVTWVIVKAFPLNEKDNTFGLACHLTNRDGYQCTEYRNLWHIEDPFEVAKGKCYTTIWLKSEGINLLPKWQLDLIMVIPMKVRQSTILMHLIESWKRYLKGDFRKLKYKGRYDRVISLCNKQTDMIKFYPEANDVILLGKEFGLIKFRGLHHRQQDQIQPRNGSLTKKADGYYLNLTFQLPIETKPDSDKTVGIDPGVVHLLSLSDGKHIPNPRFLKQAFDRLQFYQRKLSRQKLRGKNWTKTQQIIARLHKTVADQRRLNNHKISSYLIDEYGIIGIEDTKLTNMTRKAKPKKREDGKGYEHNGAKAKSRLNDAILDSGIGQLRTFLESKASILDNREVFRVPAKYTSQRCSRCGYTHKDNRIVQDVFNCGQCCLIINADLNAAINIESYILNSLDKDKNSD